MNTERLYKGIEERLSLIRNYSYFVNNLEDAIIFYNGNVWSDDCVEDLIVELEEVSDFAQDKVLLHIKNIIIICNEFLVFCKENNADCKAYLDYLAEKHLGERNEFTL